MNILVIGSGGREHTITWALSKSSRTSSLYIAPGNAGTATLGENVDLDVTDQAALVDFTRRNDVGLVFIGPEQPLVDGLADRLREANVPVVGPSAAAAQLEGSKAFSKDFMQRHGIPTAAYRTFEASQLAEAQAFIRAEGAPIVVKASGLAAGKGAIVCMTLEEAEQALVDLMQEARLGEAGRTVVVESFMQGEEASLFVLTDGSDFALLPTAQDHKRVGEGDTGPNTGGMGAYAPAPVMTEARIQEAVDLIVKPTLAGMKEEGAPYQGILYVGLMITEAGPKVVEYNCRLGDPETQVVLPMMESDAVDVFEALATGRLSDVDVDVSSGSSACVVVASGGYPGSYDKGKRITGINEVQRPALVFHAGVRGTADGGFETSGGRVLAVSAQGDSLQEALDAAYAGVDVIDFEGAFHRRDIGHRGLSRD